MSAKLSANNDIVPNQCTVCLSIPKSRKRVVIKADVKHPFDKILVSKGCFTYDAAQHACTHIVQNCLITNVELLHVLSCKSKSRMETASEAVKVQSLVMTVLVTAAH